MTIPVSRRPGRGPLFLGLILLVAAASMACSGGTAAVPTVAGTTTAATPLPPAVTVEAPTALAVSTASPYPSTAGGTVLPEADPMIQRAKQSLAGQAGMATDQIQVVSVARVAWPDSALGCPRPGQMYAQIVTPGYRIVLAAGGKTYEYHTDLTQRVISCTTP